MRIKADPSAMAVRGLTLDDLERYLADPLVHAVGGSWLAPRDLIQRRDWPQITENARRAAEIVRAVRR